MDLLFYGKITLQRYIELTALEIILSAVITALDYFNHSSVQLILFSIALLGIIVFNIINIYFTRQCCFTLANFKSHYIIHIIAYILFSATGVVVYLNSPSLYRCIYSLTNFLNLSGPNVVIWKSVLLFHSICFSAIMAAPVGMHWVQMRANYDYDFEDENNTFADE